MTTQNTPATTIQDRTPEFHTILHQAQKTLARQRKPGQPQPPLSQPLLATSQQNLANGSAPTRKQRSEFASNAAQIGRGISATMGKLQRLGELAKRKTLFDDKPVEIAELTFVIKQDLAGLNQAIGRLQGLSRGVSGGGGTGKGSGAAGQEEEHNKNVVVLLQGKLADVGVNFKEVLEVRTKNIQASRSRQENFVSSVGHQGAVAGGGGGPASQQQLDFATRRTDSPLYSNTTNTPLRTGTPNNRLAPQNNGADLLTLDPSSTSALYSNTTSTNPALLQEQQQLTAPNTYIAERGQAIEAIERTINELGSIFGQLSQMVSEQAEQIQRIDANTDDVVDNVAGAQRELMKYWARVQGNRWLVAKLFGVLMIFFLVWVLVAG